MFNGTDRLSRFSGLSTLSLSLFDSFRGLFSLISRRSLKFAVLKVHPFNDGNEKMVENRASKVITVNPIQPIGEPSIVWY